jgi:transposase
MISDIVHVIRNGLMFQGAPAAYGPHKTLYNRIKRWSQISVFDRIFAALAAEGTATETVMIDATHFKAHRTAPHRGELAQKGAVPRRIGRTKDGLNSKLHAVCDGDGKPLILLLTEGQISDYRGAVAVLAALPPDATTMIVVRGYDRDWFRRALSEQEIATCIPSRSNRKAPSTYDAGIYKQHNLVERVFGKLKDWRRIVTRYDRCAYIFMSAICIAAIVIF